MFAIYIHLYISEQKPYILYAFIIFILSPRQLYISSTSCVFLLYRPHGSLCTKKRNDLPLCSSAHLMPPLHFLCSRRRKGHLPFKENTFMLRCFKLFPFFAHLSPQTPKSRIHIHYIYPTPSKNYMFFCRNNRNKDNISGRYV